MRAFASRRRVGLLERVCAVFTKRSEPEVIGPCRNCQYGSLVVVGWTGWEEILACTTPGCYGRE